MREFLSKLESSGAEQAGKPCLERCVVVVVLALAVVSCKALVHLLVV